MVWRMNSIGQKIEELLEEQNMSQRELSKKVGITEATMSRYINGLRVPKADILSKIANALNVTTDYLFGQSVVPKEDQEIVRKAIKSARQKKYLKVIADADANDIDPDVIQKFIDIYKDKK